MPTERAFLLSTEGRATLGAMASGRLREEMAALSDAILAISGERDLDDVLQSIVDRARHLVGARYAALGVPDEAHARFAHFLVSGLSDAEIAAIGPPPKGLGVLAASIEHGRGLRLTDLGQHPLSVGFPANHPPMKSFLGVPIRHGDEVLGILYLTEKIDAPRFSPADQELAELLARHAALAMVDARRMARLEDSERRSRLLAERLLELASTRREGERLRELVGLIIQAQEEERARIAGDLHDTTVQTLMAIGRRLRSLADGAKVTDALASELSELAGAALAEADEVHRLSRNLRPSALDHLGLVPALEGLAEGLRADGVVVTITARGDAALLSERARIGLFRIAQEALTNARRHSGATSVAVELAVEDDEAQLTVRDDGRGFAAGDGEAPAGASGGLGLAGMRERAALLGGSFQVQSAPGEGTTIGVTVPLAEARMEASPRV